jgi:hypothetical protein
VTDESPKTRWSRVDFLDRAQELKRRLEVWHVQGAEPIYAPKEPVSLMEAERQSFRDRVMSGDHDPIRDFKAFNIVGDDINRVIERPKEQCSKHITIWLLRDFIEHLGNDAGSSEAAKLVRLKIDRILDAPMNKRSRDPVLGDHVVGRRIDPSLIEEFIKAVEVFIPSNRHRKLTGATAETSKRKRKRRDTLTLKQATIVEETLKLLRNDDGYWNTLRPGIREIARASNCSPNTVSEFFKKYFDDTEPIQTAPDKKAMERLIEKLLGMISARN